MEFHMAEEIRRLAISSEMGWIQVNGQRLFGPPLWLAESWRIPKGSEVYVTNLPRQWTELDIYPLFSIFGPIYQVKMIMNFRGTNKGYCFVRFFERIHAQQAVLGLNGYDTFKGCCLAVARSFDKCRLYIGRIPQSKSDEEVKEEIIRVSQRAKRIVIVTSYAKNAFKKRYCLISYINHSDAAIARKCFLSGQINLWGKYCIAYWAKVQ